jgi:lipoprotein-anchoring transpeptidase ErfK/SrfK
VTMDSSSVGIPVDDPDGYRPPVDYAVRITSRGLFVHSAPWAVNSLGLENVGHGCISLSPEDAEWYYNAVHVGDPVIVQEWRRRQPNGGHVRRNALSPAADQPQRAPEGPVGTG